MSTPRTKLIAQTTEQARRQQIAYDRFHDAVAAFFGVNRTDLRCLDLLDLRGAQAAGELSEATGLTTGAVTTMLDRLQRAGYIRRVGDPNDRRRVLVEATELARERAQEVYGPFTELIAPLFGHFTNEQITTVREFVRITSEFYVDQVARVQALPRGDGLARAPAGAQFGAPRLARPPAGALPAPDGRVAKSSQGLATTSRPTFITSPATA